MKNWCDKEYSVLSQKYAAQSKVLNKQKQLFESYYPSMENCITLAGKAGVRENIENNVDENAKPALENALKILNKTLKP